MNWTKFENLLDKIVLFSRTGKFTGKTLLFDVCPNRTNGEEGKQVVAGCRINNRGYEQMKMGTCTQVSVLLPKIP